MENKLRFLMNKIILLLITVFMATGNSFIIEEENLKIKIVPSNGDSLKLSGVINLKGKTESYKLIVFDTERFTKNYSYTFSGKTSFEGSQKLGGFGNKPNIDNLYIIIYQIINNKAIYVATGKINLKKGEVDFGK